MSSSVIVPLKIELTINSGFSICTQVCTYVTQFAKTQHNGEFFKIQFLNQCVLSTKACLIVILYYEDISSYKAR